MKALILLALFLCTCDGHRSSRAQVVLDSEGARTEKAVTTRPARRHPFPSFNLADVKQEALYCSIVLFLAGILCAAGGLGGGGIYVTVLMVAGQLSPHDAVPLSKAVVFLGSLSSLVLNLKKAVTHVEGEGSMALIDFNICRLVVPSALLGTVMGVMMNVQMPPWLTVTLLSLVLVGVATMSAKTWWEQWQQETRQSSQYPPPTGLPRDMSTGAALAYKDAEERQCAPFVTMQNALLRFEGPASFMLLFIVVAFGVFRAHARACRLGIITGPGLVLGPDNGQMLVPDTCKAPIITAVFGEKLLANMMYRSEASELVLWSCLVVPSWACLAVVLGYGTILVKREGYSTTAIATYCGMAFFAGSFAGLIGIGGGMVFSPFFLFMGLEPSTAVATSATCIIFTSSSTTLQFLLTDRIATSLAMMYGLVNVIASSVGTTLVHTLSDRCRAKKSYITGIVCLGVFSSALLSGYKLFTMGVSRNHASVPLTS